MKRSTNTTLVSVIAFALSSSVALPSFASEENDTTGITFACSDLRGRTLEYNGRTTKSESDGYSNTRLVYKISKSPDGLGMPSGKVIWSGRTNRVDDLILVGVSKDERNNQTGFSYISLFPDVTKLHTIYLDESSGDIVVALSELQTNLFNGNPEARVFMGPCTIL